jgi:hypothetical protein
MILPPGNFRNNQQLLLELPSELAQAEALLLNIGPDIHKSD